MGTMKSIIWTLLLTISLASAGPVQLSSCANECLTSLNPKFKYAVGQTYTFNWEGQTVTSVIGTSSDQAVLDVKAQALITFRSPCDVVLQLRQTSIKGLDDKVDSSELEKRPLLVSWQDGVVESVCPHQEDPSWAVNIKRSVLSMLQHTPQFLDVTQKNVMETDIMGRCPTTYTVESGQGSSQFDIIKTKIPNQCSDRVARHSAIPSVKYNVPAEIQSTPLMNSSSVCRLRINDGIMRSVECRESHLLRPMATENGGGAHTQVVSSMKFISAKAASAVKVTGEMEKSNLLFDANGYFEPRGTQDISSLVKNLCSQLASESPASVSQLFTELVHSLRKSSAKEIRGAYNNLQGKKNCPEMTKTEKMFLDALPQAGSPGALSVMVDILKDQKVSKRQAMGWYLSLPLSKYITAESIKAVLPLVDTVSDTPVALLSITGMARRFCMESDSCSKLPEVATLFEKLSKLLGNKCQVDSKDEIRVLTALKGIGNLGLISPAILSTIKQCIKDDKVAINIRLAAIETSRNTPCISDLKDSLLDVLANKDEDSEVRIAAYLALMRCPCSKIILRIQKILSTEEHNQVGGFIMSHLNSLKKNRNPDKQEVRRLVNQMRLDRSFKPDIRRFSRHMSYNDFCPINNAGWQVESNLIYSPKSFLPRSASLNLTIDLFGHSVNLFEMGGRMENMERLLEEYLGPDGLIQKLEVEDNDEKDKSDEIRNVLSRGKRALIKANDLNAIDKMVDMKDSGIKFDGYVRLFGAEMAMINYRSADASKKVDMFHNLRGRMMRAMSDLMEGAKKVDIDMARSLMFLDTAAIFPTMSGMGIKLALNGTTTVAMALESKFDLPALMRDPKNADLKLKISPLAVTDISAAMTVDMVIAKSGVKVISTVHSSASADLTAKMVQGTSLDVKLDLPKTKVALVEIKSELLMVQQKSNNAEQTKKITIQGEATYEHGGCSERLSTFTGLRACATSSVSIVKPSSDCKSDRAPMFPLSGTGSIAMYIEKTDASMQGYSLSVAMKDEGKKLTSITVLVDTPGSTTTRKVSFKGTLVMEPDMVAKMDAKTPWGSVSLETELVNRPELKSVMAKVTADQRKYMAKWKLNAERRNQNVDYSTTVEVEYPTQPLTTILTGKLAYAPGTAFQLELKPAGPMAQMPIGIAAGLKMENSGDRRRFEVDKFEIISPLGKMVSSSSLAKTPTAYSMHLDMKYGAPRQTELHQVLMKMNTQRLSTAEAHSYKTEMTYKSTRLPSTNLDLKWEIKMDPSMMSNTLIVIHGPEAEQTTNRIYVNQYSSNKGTAGRDLVSENRLEVSYPRKSVDLKLQQELRFNDKVVKGLISVISGQKKYVDGDLNIVYKPKDANTLYEVDAKFNYPGRSIVLRDAGKIVDSRTYTISPVLTMTPGGKHQLNAKIISANNAQGTSISVESELRSDSIRSPVKTRHTFQLAEGTTITTGNKIEWDGQTRLSIDGKAFVGVAVPVVELAVHWDGRFEGKLDSRINPRDAKLDLDMKFLRFDRRIKINGVYKDQSDNRVASINVAWDADNDANKQIGIELDYTAPSSHRMLDLKSAVSVLGRRYSMVATAKADPEFPVGESMIRLEFGTPDSKKLSIGGSMVNVEKNRERSRRIVLDMTVPSGEIYKLTTYGSFVEKKADQLNFVADIKLETPFWNEMSLRLDLAGGPKPEKRVDGWDAKVVISAPKFGQIIEGNAQVDVTRDSLSVIGKYQRGPVLVNVESFFKMAETDSKSNIDGWLEIKVPKSSWQQVKIGYNFVYEKVGNNIDMNEKMTLQYKNNQNMVLETTLKLSPASMDLAVTLETPFQFARRQGLTVSGRLDHVTPKYEGSILATWNSPHKREIEKMGLEFEIERRVGQSILIKVKSVSSIPRYEASLRFDGRRLNEGKTLEGDLIVELAPGKYEIKSKLNLDRQQPEVDITVIRPSENPMRLFGRLQNQAGTRQVESRIDWGQGTVQVNGKVKFVDLTNMEGELKYTIDSPVVNIPNMNIKASIKPLDKKRRVLEISANEKTEHAVSIKSTFEFVETVGLKGDLHVEVAKYKNSMKFLIFMKNIASKDEKGVEYKMDLDFPMSLLKFTNLRLGWKMTNREKMGLVSYTLQPDCNHSYIFSLNNTSTGNKVDYVGSILAKDTHEGIETTRGLRLKHTSTAAKFEQNVELILAENSNGNSVIGYKLKKDSKEYGLEVYTPKRRAGFTMEQSKEAKQRVKTVISVWLDKICAADNKLVIVNTVEPHKLGDMEGVATVTTIKHPSFGRDLEYKVDYHLAKKPMSYNRFHVKLDMEAMDSKHERLILESYVRGIDRHDLKNMTIETELRTKRSGLAASVILNGAVSDSSVNLAGNFKFLAKGQIEKELMASLNATRGSFSMALGSPAKRIVMEERWSFDHVVGHPRLQISGYCQVFDLEPLAYLMEASTAPQIDIRVFRKSNPENNYHIRADILDDARFQMTLGQQIGAQKKDMAGLYLTLNSSDLLHTRLSWKIEELRSISRVARDRAEVVRQHIKSTLEPFAAEMKPILSKWKFDGDRAKSFYADISKRVLCIASDLASDESIQNLATYGEEFIAYVQDFDVIFSMACQELTSRVQEVATKAIESIEVMSSKMIESFRQMATDLMIRVEKYRSAIRQWASNPDGIVSKFNEYMTAFRRRFGDLFQQVKVLVEARFQKLILWLNSLEFLNEDVKNFIKILTSGDSWNVIGQKLAVIFEDEILGGIKEYLNRVAIVYPESKRIVCRMESRLEKVYNYLKSLKETKVPSIDLKSSIGSIKDSMKKMAGEVIVYDPQGGEIQYQLPLVRRISSLRQLVTVPDVSYGSLISLTSGTDSERDTLVDKFFRFRTQYDPLLLKPRVRGFASLIGSNGIVTFDKKAYEINVDGNCQYVLARDFLDKDFTVALSYDESGKSIIFSDGVDQIELKKDKILVNNKPAPSMPLKLKNISVTKPSDQTVMIQRSHGVILTCSISSDVCNLDISPFYRGRVMGLWGTFTQEIEDEFQLPTGKTAKDPAQFVSSWKLNKVCKEKDVQINVLPETLTRKEEHSAESNVCREIFHDDDSPLRACFGVVSPKPYSDLCFKSVNKSYPITRRSTLAAYFYACKRFGIPW